MTHRRISSGTFTALLGRSFRSASGAVLTLLGFTATVAAWFVSREYQVSVFWLVVMAVVAFITIATLFVAAFDAHRTAAAQLPRVRLARTAPASYRGVKLILLLDASELFSPDSGVSIYRVEDQEYESLVGFGRVITVQDNGFIQIGVLTFAGDHDELVSHLLSNDRRALDTVLVKPHVPLSLYVVTGGDV